MCFSFFHGKDRTRATRQDAATTLTEKATAPALPSDPPLPAAVTARLWDGRERRAAERRPAAVEEVAAA